MGCQAKCCAVFTFPASPDELRARWEGVDPPDVEYDRARACPSRAERYRDDHYIADMLVPLDLVTAVERGERFGITVDMSNSLPLYTCKHWNEETRLCGAYDERPRMCAEYPYGRTCDHGCEFRAPAHVRMKYAAYEVDRKPVLMLEQG